MTVTLDFMLSLCLLSILTAPQLPYMGLDAGAGVQRTIRLLSEAKPVKVMFYGQSITNSDWVNHVEADLKRRFPTAQLQTRNMAIGGFSSNLLKRCAERDSLEFYPDLIVLHVYGGEPDTEELIRTLRSTTTAEVLLQSDHIHGMPTGKPEDADADRGWRWHDEHATWLRKMAEKYGCGYVDIRSAWYKAMAERKVPFTHFVSQDKVHLNPAGDRLMADLVAGYLVPAPSLATVDPVVSIRPTPKGGAIEFKADGNRIDVRMADSAGPIQVRIEGKKPSEYKELYLPSRTTPALGAWFPALMQVKSLEVPKLETYTLRLFGFKEDARRFTFEARGSLTGDDGKGDSYSAFVSASKRVTIEPQDWATNYGYVVSKKVPPDGFEVSWTYAANFKDTIEGGGWHTIAQGLPNRDYSVRLTGKGLDKVVEVKVFRPGKY
jgi:lysophospholipase L1-like esterase